MTQREPARLAEPVSEGAGSRAFGPAVHQWWFLVWLVLLSAFFATMAAVDLANVRPLSGDEIWILSISQKLATQGQLGTDLYAGYFNGDRFWFIHLPGQHLLHWVAFKLAGVGIVQARAVSVAAALVVIWTASVLALRWYGVATAVVTSLLLVFWRSGLIGMDLGLPLLSLSRTMRYDVTPIAWTWVSYLCLDSLLRRPNRWWALAVGSTAALAVLTHFTGAVVLPVIALTWLWVRGRGVFADAGTWWILLGFLATVSPYAIYLARHWPDAVGQFSYSMIDRVPGASSLALTVAREPLRYRALLQPEIGRLLFAAGIGPAVWVLLARTRSSSETGDRVLLASFIVPAVLLSLFEVTKAPLYAEVLLIPGCLAMALAVVAATRWISRRPRTSGRRGMGLLVGGVVGLALVEGAAAYWYDRRSAGAVTKYETLGARIGEAIPEGAGLIGPERFWWPLRHHTFVAFNSLQLRWKAGVAIGGSRPTVAALAREHGVQFILMDDGSSVDLARYPTELGREFKAFIVQCTTPGPSWNDRTYGRLELRSIRDRCPD